MTSERDVHPDEGTIHAWLDRQLDDTSSATLEAHLQRCDECAERVAEARGLIAGTSRILSALDVGQPPISAIAPGASESDSAPATEPWRPVLLPTPRARRMATFRLTPARSAIAAVLVVAVGLAIVHENERPSSKLASVAAESTVAANAPTAANAPIVSNSPTVAAAPPVGSAAAPLAAPPGIVPASPSAGSQLDSTAGTRVAAARTFAKAQRETTVNADLARVAQAPAARAFQPVPSTPAGQTIAAAKAAESVAGVAGGVSRGAAPARTAAGFEAPQCYRVESASGAAATWGPVALPMVLALDAPATNATVRVLSPAGQDAEAQAVLERRGNDSLFFTLRRIGYTGTLAVGAPGEVRAGVMRSAPTALQLESVVVTGASPATEQRRALRKPSAAQSRADSAAASANRDAAPAVPVVVRKVDCRAG